MRGAAARLHASDVRRRRAIAKRPQACVRARRGKDMGRTYGKQSKKAENC